MTPLQHYYEAKMFKNYVFWKKCDVVATLWSQVWWEYDTKYETLINLLTHNDANMMQLMHLWYKIGSSNIIFWGNKCDAKWLYFNVDILFALFFHH